MITVRAYAPDDLAALSGLMLEMARDYGAALPDDLDVEGDLMRDAQNMDIAVALDAGHPVGFATFTTLFPVSALVSFTYVQQLFVSHPARRHGAGQQLMIWVVRESKARGSHRVEWSTGMTNMAARALYDALGAVGSEKMQYVLQGEAFDRLAAPEQELP